MSMELPKIPDGAPPSFFASALEYMFDAGQRNVLFLDVMRRRGEQYREHLAETVPHVLDYSVELIVDGRTLERPVNYALVRITPPKGVEIDLKRSGAVRDRRRRQPARGDVERDVPGMVQPG